MIVVSNCLTDSSRLISFIKPDVNDDTRPLTSSRRSRTRGNISNSPSATCLVSMLGSAIASWYLVAKSTIVRMSRFPCRLYRFQLFGKACLQTAYFREVLGELDVSALFSVKCRTISHTSSRQHEHQVSRSLQIQVR